jgi:hypothetical protein
MGHCGFHCDHLDGHYPSVDLADDRGAVDLRAVLVAGRCGPHSGVGNRRTVGLVRLGACLLEKKNHFGVVERNHSH